MRCVRRRSGKVTLTRFITVALAQPDVRERLALQGYDVIAGTPAQMAAQIREDTKKWAKVIRDSGAKPE